jgi:molecular chaperone DnaK
LAQAAMKLGEALYKAQSPQQPGGEGAEAGASGGQGGADDVVDADFTEVKDDDPKKSA